MSYAFVENDQIQEIHYFKPRSWRNISNFNTLNDEQLLNIGWHEIVDVVIDYDKELYEVFDTQIIYENSEVKRVPILREIVKIEEVVVEEVVEEQIVEEVVVNPEENSIDQENAVS